MIVGLFLLLFNKPTNKKNETKKKLYEQNINLMLRLKGYLFDDIAFNNLSKNDFFLLVSSFLSKLRVGLCVFATQFCISQCKFSSQYQFCTFLRAAYGVYYSTDAIQLKMYRRVCVCVCKSLSECTGTNDIKSSFLLQFLLPNNTSTNSHFILFVLCDCIASTTTQTHTHINIPEWWCAHFISYQIIKALILCVRVCIKNEQPKSTHHHTHHSEQLLKKKIEFWHTFQKPIFFDCLLSNRWSNYTRRFMFISLLFSSPECTKKRKIYKNKREAIHCTTCSNM